MLFLFSRPFQVFILTAFFLFNVCPSLQAAKTDGIIRVAVHESFYSLITPDILAAHPRLIFTKVRGKKIRYMCNWKTASRQYDVIIGLDPDSIRQDAKSQFRPYDARICVPFAGAKVTVIYDKSIKVDQTSLASFLNSLPDRCLIVQNKKISSLGKLSHQWLSGQPELRRVIYTVSNGWHSAYQIFSYGQKDEKAMAMVGYASSLQALDQTRFAALNLDDHTHPYQIWGVGVLAKTFSDDDEKAIQGLIDHCLSDRFQDRLESVYALPVKKIVRAMQ